MTTTTTTTTTTATAEMTRTSTTATDRQFPAHTEQTAPAAARSLLAGSQKLFGFVPSPLARLVTQPAVAQAFMQMNAAFERTSLTSTEREVVVMTVALWNQCHYCLAMHTASLTRDGAPAALIAGLRAGSPLPDHRLEALATFTRALLQGRGDVPAESWGRFRDAGFGHAAALEVVLGIATYTLSTFANRLTQAPPDAAFEPFRWEHPDGGGAGSFAAALRVYHPHS